MRGRPQDDGPEGRSQERFLRARQRGRRRIDRARGGPPARGGGGGGRGRGRGGAVRGRRRRRAGRRRRRGRGRRRRSRGRSGLGTVERARPPQGRSQERAAGPRPAASRGSATADRRRDHGARRRDHPFPRHGHRSHLALERRCGPGGLPARGVGHSRKPRQLRRRRGAGRPPIQVGGRAPSLPRSRRRRHRLRRGPHSRGHGGHAHADPRRRDPRPGRVLVARRLGVPSRAGDRRLGSRRGRRRAVAHPAPRVLARRPDHAPISPAARQLLPERSLGDALRRGRPGDARPRRLDQLVVGPGRLVLVQADPQLLDPGAHVLRPRRQDEPRRDGPERRFGPLPPAGVGGALARLPPDGDRGLPPLQGLLPRVRPTRGDPRRRRAAHDAVLVLHLAPVDDRHALRRSPDRRARALPRRADDRPRQAREGLRGRPRVSQAPVQRLPPGVRRHPARRHSPGALPADPQRHAPGRGDPSRLPAALGRVLVRLGRPQLRSAPATNRAVRRSSPSRPPGPTAPARRSSPRSAASSGRSSPASPCG